MFWGRKVGRWWGVILIGGIGIYALLLIPDPAPPAHSGAGQQPFVWARDPVWQNLEAQFRAGRQLDLAQRTERFEAALAQMQQALRPLAAGKLSPEATELDVIETNFFQLGVLAAVVPERHHEFLAVAQRLNELTRWQAEAWPADSPATRQRIYRLLFGRRAALEEVILQLGPKFNPLELATNQQVSATPAAEVQGVRVHSGDILVSRGGAATSALIARGNDFRGNFSHVALIHIDEQTKKILVIESRIECGVSVRPIEEYLADTKLRLMVLRLRDDLLPVQTNPQLPHQAAAWALSEALTRHIPYDFAMDYTDPSKQFCSEVVSCAYQSRGVKLWAGLSHISAPGLAHWLAQMGVRNFESQQPSDLEYDPQLRFVAEWRNPDLLLQDHMDNALIDARLEMAERGAKLEFNRWLLPPARFLKAGCWLLNQCGTTGMIPEGMSATTALRVERFKQQHAIARERLHQAVERFQQANGYVPPYWELLKLARTVIQPPQTTDKQ